MNPSSVIRLDHQIIYEAIDPGPVSSIWAAARAIS